MRAGVLVRKDTPASARSCSSASICMSSVITQGRTYVHFSAEPEHFLWDTLGVLVGFIDQKRHRLSWEADEWNPLPAPAPWRTPAAPPYACAAAAPCCSGAS